VGRERAATLGSIVGKAPQEEAMASRDALLSEVYELALQNEMNYFG
jgi:hypothetical protein